MEVTGIITDELQEDCHWKDRLWNGQEWVAYCIHPKAAKDYSEICPKNCPVMCKWTQDDDGNWNTGCGNIFIILEGTPKENLMKYCPYCGAED